jgi:hypothetical protein
MTTQTANKPLSQSARIRAILAVTPNAIPKKIAKKARADVRLVYEVKAQLRRKASMGAKLPNIVSQENTVQPIYKTKAEVEAQVNTDTEIKYSEKFVKVVDLINEYKLNYNLGSAVAHALNSNSENKRENIKAAIWYLKNELLTTNP